MQSRPILLVGYYQDQVVLFQKLLRAITIWYGATLLLGYSRDVNRSRSWGGWRASFGGPIHQLSRQLLQALEIESTTSRCIERPH